MTDSDTILKVEHLVTAFDTEDGRVRAVDDVSFELRRGSILGMVGESGCGKSVTAFSILRLLPKPMGIIEKGSVVLNGQDLVPLPAETMHSIRGKRIAMIFQEPMTALNPVHRIGRQLLEVFNLHRPELAETEKYGEALSLLEKVGIGDPERRMREYAHQISGGMRQRVMIAMALAGKPDVLIADEPTTALDVTIQAQILDLILSLQKETGMSVIFITHALGVIAEVCREVLVMYAGWIVESAPPAVAVGENHHTRCFLYTSGGMKTEEN
jgi:ABC-type dipeptide/oligopeptide/nickel transport system ATPase component